MKPWIVVTPEYGYTEVIDPEIGGPTYDVADVIEVEADTRRDAIALGVKAMLSDHRHYAYCLDQRGSDLCPFTGVKAFLNIPDDVRQR
jgi:hypothetical protein